MVLKFQIADSKFVFGNVEIKVSDLVDQQPKDQWFTLVTKSKKKDKEPGALHLSLHFTFRERLDANSNPPSEPHLLMPEHPKFYKELLFRLIQYENPNLRTEISPLSSVASALLEEYALSKLYVLFSIY